MNELLSEKTYLQVCAYSEDSDQPAHPDNLIRVFIVRLKKFATLTKNVPDENSDQTKCVG